MIHNIERLSHLFDLNIPEKFIWIRNIFLINAFIQKFYDLNKYFVLSSMEFIDIFDQNDNVVWELANIIYNMQIYVLRWYLFL